MRLRESAAAGFRRRPSKARSGGIRSPICIVIPCHRVIGANGALTGYGGGLDNKISLLAHENPRFPDRGGGDATSATDGSAND